MKLKYLMALAAVGSTCWLGCSPVNRSRSDAIHDVTVSWQVAVTNTAQSYFRLGVACGDNVNLRRLAAGQPGVSGKVLLEEAIKVAGDDHYLKAP